MYNPECASCLRGKQYQKREPGTRAEKNKELIEKSTKDTSDKSVSTQNDESDGVKERIAKLTQEVKLREIKLNDPSKDEMGPNWEFVYHDQVPMGTVLKMTSLSAFSGLVAVNCLIPAQGWLNAVIRGLIKIRAPVMLLRVTSSAMTLGMVIGGAAWLVGGLATVIGALAWWKMPVLKYRRHRFRMTSDLEDEKFDDDDHIVDERSEASRKLPVKYHERVGTVRYTQSWNMGFRWLRRREHVFKYSHNLFVHSQTAYNDDHTLDAKILKERNIKTLNVLPVNVDAARQQENELIQLNTLKLRLNWLRAEAERAGDVPFPGASQDNGMT